MIITLFVRTRHYELRDVAFAPLSNSHFLARGDLLQVIKEGVKYVSTIETTESTPGFALSRLVMLGSEAAERHIAETRSAPPPPLDAVETKDERGRELRRKWRLAFSDLHTALDRRLEPAILRTKTNALQRLFDDAMADRSMLLGQLGAAHGIADRALKSGS